MRLFNTKRMMSKHYIELKSDVMLMVRELSSSTLALFDDIHSALEGGGTIAVDDRARSLQSALEEANRDLLPLLTLPDRRDAGALSNFVTYSRRLQDKLASFARLSLAPNG